MIGGLADLLVREGRVAEALAMLEQGEAILREVTDPMELGKLLCIRSHAALEQGDVDAARRAHDEAESLAAPTGAGADSALRRAIFRLHAAIG